MSRAILRLVMVASVLFASCTKEAQRQDSKEVKLKISAMETRAVTDPGTLVTAFAEGDKVKVCSKGLYSDMDDEICTVKVNGDLESARSFNYEDRVTATFHAFYPATAVSEGGRTSFRVAIDQSTDQAFVENDFMTASATGASESGIVELDFVHRLALIKIVLNEIPDSDVTIKNVYTAVSWNQESGYISTLKSEDVQDIKAGRNLRVRDAVEYWACVPAQIIAAGKPFVTAKHEGKDYIYKPTSIINLVEGQVYEINLSLPKVADSDVKVVGKKLYVKGEEFFMKGVDISGLTRDATGYNPFLKAAIDAGANTVRIYDVGDLGSTVESTKKVMDELYENGVYVNFGLFVGRQQDGFDYSNTKAREEQLQRFKEYIEAYKKHPAIIMWTIGNECDGEDYSDMPNNNVWKDINELATYIKHVDGRPTSTALTGTWPLLGRYKIQQYIPQIDIISINAYEGDVIANLHSSYPLDKPYMISEFGPAGTWDSSCTKTSWGGLVEKNSVDKALSYKMLYNNYVLPHKDEGCIGSSVFIWGFQTHGAVLTWFAMFDQFENAALNSVDTMSELWGKTVSNYAPTIGEVTIDSKQASSSVTLSAGQKGVKASVIASDPEGDCLAYDWKVVVDQRQAAGVVMNPIEGLFPAELSNDVTFTAPSTPGNYRLIVYARDRAHGKAAMAVMPFRVK